MKFKHLLVAVLSILSIIVACSPDDPTVSLVPDRDRTEQQIADKDSLITYLETHYYNSQELNGIANINVTDIDITELVDGETLPDGHTLLIDVVETKVITYEEADYEYYILKINQGGGDSSPKFTDKVRVTYEGRTVADDAEVFDSAVTPTDFNLVGGGLVSGGVIKGWQLVFPEFNVAEGFVPGSTTVYNNYGVGVMFIPSGLAYFSSTLVGIPSYSNLIFKFSLLQTEVNDHDNDGIPSYLEDLNNDFEVLNDDTDENSISNYIDGDDDGDGVLTRNELERTEYVVDTNSGETEPVLQANEFELSRTTESGVITIITGTIADSNSNDIADYLEENIAIDYSDTE